MNTEIETVYIGTFIMLFLSLTIVFFVVYSSIRINKFQRLIDEKHEYYMSRVDSLEDLIKTQMKDILLTLKNKL